LSAGTFNSDKVVPAEFLPDGQFVRDPQNATSTWTLSRAQLANLTYTAPPLGDRKPVTFRVEGFEALETINHPTGTVQMPTGKPIATTTIDVAPDAEGVAKMDIAAKVTGGDWDKANFFLVRDVPDGLLTRLASGNMGVTAAVNETIAAYELPTVLLVYLAVIILTFFTYFDWRATLCCCLPLTYATFFGYWFMMQLGIGLKVSTLPVIVLVVGVGIDYAYYIYNRLQYHLAVGLNITDSYKESILETGNGIIYTAITFAIGVSTWSFSPLKFQADMGLLLTFMFFLNMVMALTALPGLAVTLDTLIPRKSRPWADMDGGRWRH
jgi:predicted RND superfamily exporter protein